MKKKKIMASLVLSAMMVSTLGMSTSAATWTPNGTDEITNVSSSGSGAGIGTITHERTEELFLIAVPTNYRKFEFYADPTGNTLQLGIGNKVEFANQEQDWQFPTNVKNTNATGGHVDQGRALESNYITAYNAGSKDVMLNVRAFVSLSDGYGRTVANVLADGKTPAIAMGVTGKVLTGRNYGAGQDNLPMTGWTDATVDAKDKTLWHIDLPGSTPRVSNVGGGDNGGVEWLERKVVYENNLKYTKDYAVSLEEYNQYAINTSITNPGAPIPTREEFKYPAASFRLNGAVNGAGDKIWDTKGLTAHLGLKWYITCEDSEEPWIDPVVVAQKGKDFSVEVKLGSGESAMNTVTQVIWDVTAEEAPNQTAFKMDVLAAGECTYKSGSGNNGEIVFKASALDALYNYASLNGSTMRVIMANGDKTTAVSFVLWVQ